MEREKSQAITKKRMTELSGELKHKKVSVVLKQTDPRLGPVQTVCKGSAGESLLVGNSASSGVRGRMQDVDFLKIAINNYKNDHANHHRCFCNAIFCRWRHHEPCALDIGSFHVLFGVHSHINACCKSSDINVGETSMWGWEQNKYMKMHNMNT